MPRQKRNGLFDFLKPRSTVYHVKRKRGPTETSTTHYKGYTIYKRGSEGYSVPSLDRESTFDDKRQAKRFIDAMKKYNPKRKRNIELGLPSNKFVNAKVRMKGGKIQVMADERVLGKAGFKAGAGLSGVSVSGGAKLNPRVGYGMRSRERADAVRDAQRARAEGYRGVKIKKYGDMYEVSVREKQNPRRKMAKRRKR